MKEYAFKIPSMHDEVTSKEIASTILGMNGIENVDVDYQEGMVNVYYNENKIVIDKIKQKIEDKGFTIKKYK